MNKTKIELYFILTISCLAGYFWLYINSSFSFLKEKSIEVCLIKHATNLPCPSCGSTRSLISLLNGDFLKALSINPLGYIIAIVLFTLPIWLILDFTLKYDSLYVFYKKTESIISKPYFSIPLVILVFLNWVWNISKEL